mgnify:CR=1 FL=1
MPIPVGTRDQSDPRSNVGFTIVNLPHMDQGSAPALKQIFGQGFPKLHPFGLSPLIFDQA